MNSSQNWLTKGGKDITVQDGNPNPGTESYKWQQIVIKKLETKGIRFPVPNPWQERQKQEGKPE